MGFFSILNMGGRWEGVGFSPLLSSLFLSFVPGDAAGNLVCDILLHVLELFPSALIAHEVGGS